MFELEGFAASVTYISVPLALLHRFDPTLPYQRPRTLWGVVGNNSDLSIAQEHADHRRMAATASRLPLSNRDLQRLPIQSVFPGDLHRSGGIFEVNSHIRS